MPHIESQFCGGKLPASYNVPAGAAYEAPRGAEGRLLRQRAGGGLPVTSPDPTELGGQALQETSAAVEQLAYRALVGLHEVFIQGDAACGFVDEVRDQDVKQRFLKSCERSLNEALSQTLEPSAATVDGPYSRSVEMLGISEHTVDRGVTRTV
jgi:hypothetical protein